MGGYACACACANGDLHEHDRREHLGVEVSEGEQQRLGDLGDVTELHEEPGRYRNSKYSHSEYSHSEYSHGQYSLM